MRLAPLFSTLACLLLALSAATRPQEAADRVPAEGVAGDPLTAFLDRAVVDGVAGFPEYLALAGEPAPDGSRALPPESAPGGRMLRFLPPEGRRGLRLELRVGTSDGSTQQEQDLNNTYDGLRVSLVQHFREQPESGGRPRMSSGTHLGRGSSSTISASWKGQLAEWRATLGEDAAEGLIAAILEIDDSGRALTLTIERVERPRTTAPDPNAPLLARAQELAARGTTRLAFIDEHRRARSDVRFYTQYEQVVLPEDALGELIALVAEDAANDFSAVRAQPEHEHNGLGWKYNWTRTCGPIHGSDLVSKPHWPVRLVPAGVEEMTCWSQVTIDPRDQRASCLLWLPAAAGVDAHAATIDAALGAAWARVEEAEDGWIEWRRDGGGDAGGNDPDTGCLRLSTKEQYFFSKPAKKTVMSFALVCVSPNGLPLRNLPLRPIAALGVRNGPTGPVKIAEYLNVSYEGQVWPNQNRQLRAGRDQLVAIEGVQIAPLSDDEVLALFEGPADKPIRLTLECDGERREVLAGRAPTIAPGEFERVLEDPKSGLRPSQAVTLLDGRRFPALLAELINAAEEEFESVAGPAVDGARVRRLAPNYLGSGESVRWQRLTWNEDYLQIELAFAPPGESAVKAAQARSVVTKDPTARLVELSLLNWFAYLFPADAWKIEESDDVWRATRRDEPLLGPCVTLWRGEALLEIRAPSRAHRERLRANPALAQGRCVEGNCQDGFGRYLFHGRRAEYEGEFVAGLPHGVGRSVRRDGEVYVGSVRNGFRDGPGIRVWPEGRVTWDLAGRRNVVYAMRVIYKDGFQSASLEVDLLYPWGASDELKARFRDARAAAGGGSDIGYEHGLYLARNGRVLEGDTQNGHAKVELPGIGVHEGRFVDGKAEGRGLLRRQTGGLYLMDCARGIPSLQRVLIPPNELSWEAYEAEVTLLRIGDCLRGDCWNGRGTMLMNWGGAYVGTFRNNEPEGTGELWDSLLGRHGKYTGTFKAGRKNGRFDVRQFSGGVETHWYKDDQRVTSSGEDYYAWLKNERRRKSAGRSRPSSSSSGIITMACSACRATGWYDSPGKLVEEWSTSSFLPGDRNYGSWMWSGYARKTGRSVNSGGYSGPCPTCNGDGIIRVDQPLGSPLR